MNFEKEEKNSRVDFDIDKMQTLDTYFPNFNYFLIIDKLNQSTNIYYNDREKRIKRRRSNRTLLKYSNFTRHNKYLTNSMAM